MIRLLPLSEGVRRERATLGCLGIRLVMLWTSEIMAHLVAHEEYEACGTRSNVMGKQRFFTLLNKLSECSSPAFAQDTVSL